MALISLAALGVLLWRMDSKNFQASLNENRLQDQLPVTYLINSETTQHSGDGKIAYTLASTKTLYFDNAVVDDHPEVTMENPRFKMYDQVEDSNTAVWEISALYAEGSEQRDQWLLKGKVIVTQQTENGGLSTFSTSELLFKPRQHYAETSKPVTINSPSGITQATGLKIFLNDERIELLSNVTSQYDLQMP